MGERKRNLLAETEEECEGREGVQWALAKEAESQSDTAGETRKPKQTALQKYRL